MKLSDKKEINEIFKDAKWISAETNPFVSSDCSFLFRKSFEVYGTITSARLYICALGLGVYTINGKAVTEEVLCTPFTKYDKRVMYQVYDVTEHLHSGRNAIGVHAGNGFYNNNMSTWGDCMSSWRDDPKMIAVLLMETENGEKHRIITDTSWKWLHGPCIYNHMRQGEIFDASFMQKGFDTADFDDSHWKKTKVTHAPGGILEAADITPIRIVKKIKPVAQNGNIYDFGTVLSGWAKIKCRGEKGRKIIMSYRERVEEDSNQTHNLTVFLDAEGLDVKLQSIYIMNGEGEEEYTPCFCYYGFRYVIVENAPEDFEIEAQEVHTDFETVGNFQCNDEMLNKLHKASLTATLSNYVGIPTDCPHREQNGWTGDTLVSSDQALMNFDMTKAYKKWIRDFKDVQRPSGQIPGMVPSGGWGYNWGSGPAWDSALIQIPWKLYLVTGDDSLIHDMWENMCLYMQFMEQMSEDCLVDYGLGDWNPPRDAKRCPTVVTDTGYYHANCRLMAKMAALQGYNTIYWENKAEQIKESWRRNFLHNPEVEDLQTFWACAVYQGFLEPEEIQWAVEKLAALTKDKYKNHLYVGILGMKYALAVLSEYGYMELVYDVVTNSEYPSYAYWMNHGMTSLCEEWDMTNSQNHQMYSDIDNWFYRYIGGIRFDEEGVKIQPVLLEGVREFKVTHREISVERKQEKIVIHVPVKAAICINGKEESVEPGEYVYQIYDKTENMGEKYEYKQVRQYEKDI